MKITKNIKTLLFNILLLFNFTIVHAQNIIYVSSLENDGYQLYELDLSDCSLTNVTTIQTPVFDITFHPNGNLYGINPIGELYRININTGAVTLIHTFGNGVQTFNSMTADNDGLIYVSGNLGEFYTYDIPTDEEIFRGTINFSPSGDFTFYQGNLYVAVGDVGDAIVQVNINNPSSSNVVINQNLDGDIFGIVSDAFDCSNVETYAMAINIDNEETNIYQIDFENNSLQFLCDIGLEFGGGASTLEFLSSTAISINDYIVEFPTTCFGDDASIEIFASGGIGELEYSINQTDFQPNNTFTNLPQGIYTITIRDENNCITTQNIDISIPPLIIESIPFTGDACEEEQRDFEIQLLDFSGLLNVTVNDSIVQSDLSFENYDAGIYDINIMDEFGCEIDTTITIKRKFCDIYIPNAFSPDGDGTNDLFQIYPHPLFEGEVLSFLIFDRWGNVLYESNAFDIFQDGWNGFSRGKKLNPGVFVYLVRVDFRDGIVRTLSGDVTLVE